MRDHRPLDAASFAAIRFVRPRTYFVLVGIRKLALAVTMVAYIATIWFGAWEWDILGAVLAAVTPVAATLFCLIYVWVKTGVTHPFTIVGLLMIAALLTWGVTGLIAHRVAIRTWHKLCGPDLGDFALLGFLAGAQLTGAEPPDVDSSHTLADGGGSEPAD